MYEKFLGLLRFEAVLCYCGVLCKNQFMTRITISDRKARPREEDLRKI